MNVCNQITTQKICKYCRLKKLCGAPVGGAAPGHLSRLIRTRLEAAFFFFGWLEVISFYFTLHLFIELILLIVFLLFFFFFVVLNFAGLRYFLADSKKNETKSFSVRKS